MKSLYIYIFYIFALFNITLSIDYFNYRHNMLPMQVPFYSSEQCYSSEYAESVYNRRLKKLKLI